PPPAAPAVAPQPNRRGPTPPRAASRPTASVSSGTLLCPPKSEDRNDRTLVLVQNKLPHLGPRQRLRQLQQSGVVFIAGAHGHHVDVRGLGAFDDDGVSQRHKA